MPQPDPVKEGSFEGQSRGDRGGFPSLCEFRASGFRGLGLSVSFVEDVAGLAYLLSYLAQEKDILAVLPVNIFRFRGFRALTLKLKV